MLNIIPNGHEIDDGEYSGVILGELVISFQNLETATGGFQSDRGIIQKKVHFMSTSHTSNETLRPQVFHGTQPLGTTSQTRGMERRPGIDNNTAGANRIWMGHVTCVPNELGPPHHHGEAETAAYVLSGNIRVYFGEDFKEYVDAGPGDYLFVPANTPHIEGNVTDEPAEAVLTRSPDNIVVNLGE